MTRAFLAALLLCAVSSCGMNPAFAKPCVETGDVMRPVCGMGLRRPVGARGEPRHIRQAEHPTERQRAVRVRQAVSRVSRTAAARAVDVPSFGVPQPSIGYTLAAPIRFIRGRLVCAVNVGAALAQRGIKGTGSALARSYLSWGHSSGPVPGAVAVFSRRGGGHVAIVDHVAPDGTVIYQNPSTRRQAWQVGPYSRKPIAFRVAGDS